jgi:transposase-like protein
MAKHRNHSVEFKRQVAQEFIAGETLHSLAKRHDLSRNLIRVWVRNMRKADWTTMRRPLTSSRNTRPASRHWSGWSASRRSSWSS